MNYGWWLVVILVTALAFMLIPAWLTGRGGKLERTQLQARLEEGMGRVQLPRAGLLPLDHLPETGPSGPWLEPEPFNMTDTGPLLFWSDKMAANVALEREIRQRCVEAEAKIPPRWR